MVGVPPYDGFTITAPLVPKLLTSVPVAASIAIRRLPVMNRMRGAFVPSPGQ
jgi:hypothetical protein